MLVDLTPNIKVVEDFYKIAAELNIENYKSQTDPTYRIEKGIYYTSGIFREIEFLEKLDGCNYTEKKLEKIKKEDKSIFRYLRKKYKWVDQSGIADNLDQIKNFYKKQIKDKHEKFVIVIHPIWQEKGIKNGFR